MLIKALSVKQPWANMIASGKKTIETRTWRTNYRGLLLIVSSKLPDTAAMPASECPGPFGVALCIVEVMDCRRMLPGDIHAACCGWGSELYSWVLRPGAVRQIEPPFAVRGRPGLFDVEVPEYSILKA